MYELGSMVSIDKKKKRDRILVFSDADFKKANGISSHSDF